MDWLGNQISRFIRLGLQEWQFWEFALFWLVLTHPSWESITVYFFRFLTLLLSLLKNLRASLNGMDWLGNKISRFVRLGLQEQQFGEFGLFLLVLTHPS